MIQKLLRLFQPRPQATITDHKGNTIIIKASKITIKEKTIC